MSSYSPQELAQDWEFGFLRANTNAFRKPEVFARVLQEEARAGWQLVEKFDDARLRFKRPKSAKEKDTQLEFDPYRTRYGISEAKFALLVLAIVFGALLVTLAIVALTKGFD